MRACVCACVDQMKAITIMASQHNQASVCMFATLLLPDALHLGRQTFRGSSTTSGKIRNTLHPNKTIDKTIRSVTYSMTTIGSPTQAQQPSVRASKSNLMTRISADV